ncbi:hypothetical protein K9M79_00150 [Candidatus Woesearchaeota archaeon]|nr:hypothetical protein [Candidatus Woesearchaeota archaeon]
MVDLHIQSHDRLYLPTDSITRHNYGVILPEGTYVIELRPQHASTRFIDDKLHSIPEIRVERNHHEINTIIPGFGSTVSLEYFIEAFKQVRLDYFNRWASQIGQCDSIVSHIKPEIDKTYCLATRKINEDQGIFHNPGVKDHELFYTCDGMYQHSAYFARKEDAFRMYSVALECMVDAYSRARMEYATAPNMTAWLDLIDDQGVPVFVGSYDDSAWSTVEVSAQITDPLFFHLKHDIAKETICTLADNMASMSAIEFHQRNEHLNNGHDPPLLN